MNVKDFIEESRDSIKNREWDKLYSEAHSTLNSNNYAELNKILEGSGVLYTSILHEITRIPSTFLEGCEHIPNPLVLPSNIKEIGNFAFYNRSGLTSVTIPDSVTSIGFSAFESCSRLTRIDFGGTKSQWRAIEKDPAWRYNSGIHIIHCTDGDLKYA